MMKLLHTISNKIMERGESPELTCRIHNEFIDFAFHGSNIPMLLAIFSATVLYFILLSYGHNYHLDIWYLMTVFFYVGRLGMISLYKNGRFLWFQKRKERISLETICFLGGFVGITWLYLISTVFFSGDYTFVSKVVVSGFLMLFTFSSLFLHCMIPMWCISYVVTIFFPFCLYLTSQGSLGLLASFSLSCYIAFLLAMSYRNYILHFKALYLQYQNKDYAMNIDKYNSRLENLNNDLKFKNEELVDEIKKRKVAEKEMRKIASKDSLTGVTNRVSLEARMNRVLRNASRSETLVGVLFLDFDRFKAVNDTFGHHVGDELLKSVSSRLISIVRSTDEIFRIGGDEFVLLLTNIKEKKSIVSTTEVILSALEKPHIIDDITIILKASIGISLYPNNSIDPDELLKFADSAMYHSKDRGGDSYTFYEKGMS